MSLSELGFDARFAFLFDQRATGFAEYAAPGRIVRVDRGRVLVHNGAEVSSLPLTGSLSADPPVVGDFVGVDPVVGRILFVVERQQLLSRRRPGTTRPQAVAANVDVALLATPADRLNPSWVERALSLSWEGGARPVVLLTKADLLDDEGASVAELEARAVGVEVVPVSPATGAGVDEVRARIPAGTTAVVLGPSGAGKSTLLNALLGEDVAAVGEVRSGDKKGRHTTVRRELHRFPGGGMLIDTPGTRELGLLAPSEEADTGFADIDGLAEACRFRDCAHQGEPGCAVRAAVEDGELDEARYRSFSRQQRERRWLEEKAAATDHRRRAREKGFARVVEVAKAKKRGPRG